MQTDSVGWMSLRLIAMAVGSLLCAALLFIARELLNRAPVASAASPSTVRAVVAWAFMLTTALIPPLCIISLLRGWLAWAAGATKVALGRLLWWPFSAACIAIALLALGSVT